jgi:Fe2+ or Zn2+ uptake regulation protein
MGAMVDEYVKLLKNHAIKVTAQRLEVLRYLDRHRTHPTVERIYTILKAKHPSLSKTTVYNTLETLKKNHLVTVLSISGSESRYDLSRNLHHHFLCTRCGRIIDIDIACPNMDKTTQGGHRIDEVHGYFKGICSTCLRKRRNTHG